MERIKSIHDQVRMDCIEAIIIKNLRERMETISPGYPCKVMWLDRERCCHSAIWNPHTRNFTEIHLHNDFRHKIEFNYIRHDI